MRALRLNRALDAVMAMVSEANGYFAEMAPWVLKKTDPARMAQVLYTTAEAVRRIALLIQPAVPEAAATLLDQLAVPRGARGFDQLATPLVPGTPLPEPQGVFPRYVEAA